jgi:predicted Fe-Mo cluster-binding NifX family protein
VRYRGRKRLLFSSPLAKKKGEIVKIAITSQGDNLEASVDPRFGRCAYFIIIDPETEEFEAVLNSSANAMGGAGPQAAQTIANKGVEEVITGNVGPNAFQTLRAANTKIYQVASGTVKETLAKYKKGELKELSNFSVPDHFGLKQGGQN